MLLYCKITKYTTFLAVFLIAVLFIRPANAESISSSLDLHEFLRADVSVNSPAELVDLNDSYYIGVGTRSVATFKFTVSARMVGIRYVTPLYFNGYARYFVDIPISVSSGQHVIGVTCDSQSSNPNNNGAYLYSFYNLNNAFVRIYFNVFFDNFYNTKNNNYIAAENFNVSVSVSLPLDYVTSSLYLGTSSPSISSTGVSLSTSVLPSTTSGQAGVISEAVSFGIYNSSLDDLLAASNSQLNSANTNLSTIISVLNSIKSQDLSLYNEIISKIVAQTQNDTALQQAFIQYLTAQLRGQSSIYDPYSGSGQFVFVDSPIGDIAARIWNELTNFRIIFTDYIYANQSEAADVNSEAASQESALSDLQESLVVPTPAVDGVLNDLASDIANPGISTGQGDVFFFLRSPYLVKILAFVFSIGLAGFILYGKG